MPCSGVPLSSVKDRLGRHEDHDYRCSSVVRPGSAASRGSRDVLVCPHTTEWYFTAWHSVLRSCSKLLGVIELVVAEFMWYWWRQLDFGLVIGVNWDYLGLTETSDGNLRFLVAWSVSDAPEPY